MRYKTNNNVAFLCKYKVVWCSKYRRKVLTEDIASRLKELIHIACSEVNVDIIDIEIRSDYVMLLLETPPQYGIHRAVKHIKSTTSRIMREEFISLRTRIPTLWTNSYFVSTIDGARDSDFHEYIESQKNM